MRRMLISVKVNGKKVPNTLIYDVDSTINEASQDYIEDLVRQLICRKQNIDSIDYEVIELNDTDGQSNTADVERPIDATMLSLFTPSVTEELS